MILRNVFWKTAEVALVLLIGAGIVYGHVTIQPKQSAPGKTEKYTMKVPTEKFVPTVRIDVEFPTALVVLTVEPKAGWEIQEKRDASGKLVGAILTGGSIPTGESSEFYFTGRNPDGQRTLSWKVIQIYQDGSKSEWTGAAGSRTPAPLVELTK
jgi:uncharacterized protein YcnI